MPRHGGDTPRKTGTRARDGADQTGVRTRRTCEYMPSPRVHTHTHTHTRARIYLSMYVHVRLYVMCTRARVYVCIYLAPLCACIYTQVYRYVHTERGGGGGGAPQKADVLGIDEARGAHHRCLDLRISVDRRLMPRTRRTMYLCVCVCVCMCERKRGEREREIDGRLDGEGRKEGKGERRGLIWGQPREYPSSFCELIARPSPPPPSFTPSPQPPPTPLLSSPSSMPMLRLARPFHQPSILFARRATNTDKRSVIRPYVPPSISQNVAVFGSLGESEGKTTSPNSVEFLHFHALGRRKTQGKLKENWNRSI